MPIDANAPVDGDKVAEAFLSEVVNPERDQGFGAEGGWNQGPRTTAPGGFCVIDGYLVEVGVDHFLTNAGGLTHEPRRADITGKYSADKKAMTHGGTARHVTVITIFRGVDDD